MPEYSSTTLTPTNETKVPAMQNNSSGNFQLDALKAYILAEKAQANGLASLDATGKLVSSQIPDNLDDVLVYGSYALLPATGVEGKIYITADTNSMYRWDASLETPDYVMLAVDLEEYATKAELQAETNQRKASDSRLEARLENLEQKAGDYTTVQYRGTTAVPTGKAKYGLVEKIVGKTRAWNQLVQNGNFADSSGWSSSNQCTITGVSSNVLSAKINSDNVNCRIVHDVDGWILGHKYLLVGSIKTPYSQAVKIAMGTLASGYIESGTLTANAWNYVCGIAVAEADNVASPTIRVYPITSTGTYQANDVVQVREVFARDLTTILDDWNPSDITTANIPLMVQQIPDLLKGDAYDAGSLVDTEVSGVRSKSRNLWDEEWELGRYNTATGQKEEFSLAIRCKNAIEVLPSTDYYVSTDFAISSHGIYLFFYDIDDNYISYAETYIKNFTTPQNAYKLRFRMTTGYGTTYHNNLCINKSDSLNGTYTPYHAPNTLSFPSTTLKRAGSVAEMYYPETGEVTHPLKRQAVGTGWLYRNDGSILAPYFYKDVLSWGIAFRDSPAGKNNILLAPYVNVKRIDLQGADMVICTDGSPSQIIQIAIKDSRFNNTTDFSNYIKDFEITYEPITPDPSTFVTPIIDNTLLTEGGGTIDTIQEQSPVIDNSLDVGYLTL